ncbi:MAG: hypothetical protein ACI9J3_002805 [Parvicellaceae bacterium]|jgi:hypothetical protein
MVAVTMLSNQTINLIMNFYNRRAMTTLVMILTAIGINAAEFESNGASTDWSNPASWTVVAGTDGDGIPDITDSVTIMDGDIITVTANSQCELLDILSSGGNTVFNTNTGTTLTISTTWQHFAQAVNASIDVNISGTVNVTGRYLIDSYYNTAFDIDIFVATGGAISVAYTSTNTFLFNGLSSGASLIVNGTFDVAGSLHFLLFSGSQMTITIAGELEVEKNLQFNPRNTTGAVTISLDGGTLDCNEDLILNASQGASAANLLIDMKYNGARLEVENTITLLSSGGTIDSDASASTMAYDGVNQTLSVDAKIKYNTIELSGSGTKTLEDDLRPPYLLGDITVNSGATFNTGGFQLHVPLDLTINGTMNMSGLIDIDNDLTIGSDGLLTSIATTTMSIEGDWTNSGTYVYFSGDNIIFDGSSAVKISGATTWYELTINNPDGVSVASGDQDIEGILDIDIGTFTATGQNVRLVSSSSATAQMDDIGIGSYVGDLEVERFVDSKKQGWREMSSPVSSTALNNWKTVGMIFTGFTGSQYPSHGWNNAYYYNDTLANGTPGNGYVAAENITDFTGPTRGWRIYTDSVALRTDVIGNPIQGDFTIDLNYEDDAGTADEEGWNFVGNPFACTIDWDAIDLGDMTNIDDAYWVWITDDVVTPQYGLYVGGDGTGTNGTTQYMPHSHAFWVHATANNPSITIRESDKNTTDQAFYKSGSIASNLIKVSAYNDAALLCDQAILKTKAGASNGFVLGEDYPKLWTDISFVEQTTSLMFVAGGEELSYNAIGNSSQDVYLKSYVGTSFAGNVTLRFENIENFNGTACVTLEDLYTGMITDLRQNAQYTYTRNLLEPAIRFVIHITEQLATVATVNASCSDAADGVIMLNGITAAGYNVNWMDAAGNVIGTAFDTDSNFDITGLVAGNYSVALNAGCAIPNMNLVIAEPAPVVANFTIGNPTIDLATGNSPMLSNISSGSGVYTWDMGDGNIYNGMLPGHVYTSAGTYQITLTAENKNQCEHIMEREIIVINSSATEIEEDIIASRANAYSTETEIVVSTNFTENKEARISVLTVEGKLIYDENTTLGETTVKIPKTGADGIYLVNIQLENSTRLVYKIK